MGEEICDTCGSVVLISGRSKSVTMCKQCNEVVDTFQKSIEKEELEFKQMMERKNNEK